MQLEPNTVSDPGPIPHLYVHVPFCPTICPFCSFHVLRRRDDLVEAYLVRLDTELAVIAERWPDCGPLGTVYLGGGTPSHLTDAELGRLLGSIRRRFVVEDDAEIGIEVHPLNVEPDRPARWRDLGFTRVSVGVQSTQDPVLRALGRPHDAATALRALESVRSAGGWTVNADLIVAVDGQDVAADLHRLAATGVDHLAAYTLTVEEGTPFGRRGVSVDEEAERRAIELAAEILPGYGLTRYEVSNHARPGHRCTHNLAYWRGRSWFGAGPSATASLPGAAGGRRLVRNPPLEDWLAGAAPEEEPLDALEVLRVRLLTGLRLAEGVDEAVLDATHAALAAGPSAGPDDPGAGAVAELEAVRARIEDLCDQGRLERRAGRLVVPADEMVVLERLLAELW